MTSDLEICKSFVEAAWTGNIDMAKRLWGIHQALLVTDPAAAAMAGSTEDLQRLLARSPAIIRETLAPYDRPLLCYCCFSHLIKDSDFESNILSTVAFLLRSGCNPDSSFASEWGTEEWNETALYGAAGVLNHPGLTKMLLDAGADPDDGAIQDGIYHGESLYHACDFPGNNECLRLILEANPSQVAADYCIKRKLDFEDEEGVRLFLEAGANPNANRPRTALSHAVLRGRSLTILEILLDVGADPNQPDEDGTNAYVWARRLANKEAAVLFEAHGARQEFQLHDAILIAAADGDNATVQRLVTEYPDVLSDLSDLGRQENDGFALGSAGQILHDLARLGQTTALRSLLDLGVSSGLVNRYNETPLHWACVAGRAETARLLLERGAPMDVPEIHYNCVPMQWIYWGSEYWNDPHGDYGATAEVLLDFGMELPKELSGSPEVREALIRRGWGR